MKNLTTLDYWIKAHGSIDIELSANDLIKKWISTYIDFKRINNVFEIGCYPGRYLTIFGDQGVEVNGLDYIYEVSELSKIFDQRKYKVGKFYNDDFFKFKPDTKYDCVLSLGFIEHFQNWEDTFVKHFEYVNNNGYIVIEVPNFRGFFQRIPRMLFDYKNYKRHNVSSMKLNKWNDILIANDFEIIYSGYFGGYKLWYEEEKTTRFYFLKKTYVLRILRLIKKILFQTKAEHFSFSCFMGIIAIRK